jgi:hypothetical protein
MPRLAGVDFLATACVDGGGADAALLGGAARLPTAAAGELVRVRADGGDSEPPRKGAAFLGGATRLPSAGAGLVAAFRVDARVGEDGADDSVEEDDDDDDDPDRAGVLFLEGFFLLPWTGRGLETRFFDVGGDTDESVDEEDDDDDDDDEPA